MGYHVSLVSEQKLLGPESVMLNSSDIKNLFSDFRRNVQAFGTPWWISDLLIVDDEVRDQTIFVKIKSQLHSWTDLEIKYLFSEFGMIEEVTYLPEVSGFHSRVRFQTIYDSEWAYYYYGDGRFAHHGCCEIEMHRADDAIRWNDERNTEIKVAYGSRDTHVMMDSECLTGELLMNEEMLNQVEESIGDPAKKKLNVVKETSGLIAHQMLEEMPKSIVTHEVKFLDEIGKKNDELVDGFGLKAPPIGSVERLDDVKALGEGKPRDAIPTIHALKLDFSEQARMMNGIVNAICFDPGGTDLTYGDLAISLPNGNYESDAGEEKELIQVEGSEPVAVKEISDYIAHHVLDNMPSRETELMTELSRDNDTLNQQKLVVRVPAVPESKWDKKLDAIELLKVVDISTNGGIVTSLPNGSEKTTNELVTAEHELEVATAQEKIGMGCIETLCFDPGGSLLPVDTSIRTKLTEISILVGSSSFPLRDDLCLDWIAYRKAEKFEFICTHLLENGDQKEMKNLVLSSLTNLQKSELHSNYSMSRGALVFLYAFCFDPGGGIYVSAMNTVMETDEIWLGSSSVLLQNVDFIQHYMSEIDVSLYWNADRKSEKVKGMLKEEDYEVCLILFYSTNGQTFDPRGQVLRNLAEPLLKTFHFGGSFMLEFDVIKEFPCPLLYYLDVVQISKGGCCKVMPFDPGGDELVVLLVADRVGDASFDHDVLPCALKIMQLMMFFLVLLMCTPHHSALKLLILEDKDPLKKGVLWQEYGIRSWFRHFIKFYQLIRFVPV